MSHRPTFTIGEDVHPIFDGPIQPQWQAIAKAKGFEVIARVRDRYHLVLRHEACKRDMVSKIFTLRTTNPLCPQCLDDRRHALCEAAGTMYLGRGDHRQYFRIRLACGHETSRQRELLERVYRGMIGIRCEICLANRLETEARARGWQLIGPDPKGDVDYRLYGHDCGHRQRVAVGNMHTGRFTCGGCSDEAAAISGVRLLRTILGPGSNCP